MSRREERASAVFSALADPTRRRVLTELAARAPATATQLTGAVAVTRQAVTKHLQSLEAAGLVAPTREGREVRYELTPGPLQDAVGWIDDVGVRWDRRLARLRRQLGAG